jgi:H+-transporting ATPase
MVTGDGFDIARETCRLLGMYTNTVGRQELLRVVASSNDEWAARKIDEADAFAEVFPEDKFDIVATLQRHGHVVGMTGDGVNDAPALRKADIGIAVHGAADAARVAADIVFTRQDTTVLSDSVIVSRMIFERLRNYILFRINSTAVILFWTFLGQVIYNFTFPAMVYVVIAGCNNFTILSIAFDHIVPDKRPLRWEYRDIVPTAVVQAVCGTLQIFVVHALAAGGYLLFDFMMASGQVQTIVFFAIVLDMQTAIFVLRTRWFFFLPRSPRPGLSVVACVSLLTLVCMVVAVYWPFGGGLEPAGWGNVGQVLLLGIFFLGLKDLIKVLVYFIMEEGFPPTPVMEPKLKTVSSWNRHEYSEVDVVPVDDVEMHNIIVLK